MKKLGFGFMRLPVLDENDRSTVDFEAVREMVDYYMQAGFSYFDTAHRYNDEMSETALRRTLTSRYPRPSSASWISFRSLSSALLSSETNAI